MQQLNNLKNRVLGKEQKSSLLTDLVDLTRELHCLPDIIGRDFEVFDPDNKLLYVIRQKPMKLTQLNILLEELVNLKKRDQKNVPKMKKERGRR